MNTMFQFDTQDRNKQTWRFAGSTPIVSVATTDVVNERGTAYTFVMVLGGGQLATAVYDTAAERDFKVGEILAKLNVQDELKAAPNVIV